MVSKISILTVNKFLNQVATQIGPQITHLTLSIANGFKMDDYQEERLVEAVRQMTEVKTLFLNHNTTDAVI